MSEPADELYWDTPGTGAGIWRSLAAAAIKAMREPSFPMVKAMLNTKDDGAGSLHERKWKAAIDAALVGEG